MRSAAAPSVNTTAGVTRTRYSGPRFSKNAAPTTPSAATTSAPANVGTTKRTARRKSKELAPPGRRGLKKNCPGCRALKAEDWADRWPVGYCGPDCLMRRRG